MPIQHHDELECERCRRVLPVDQFRHDGRRTRRNLRATMCQECERIVTPTPGILPEGWHIGDRVRVVATRAGWTATERTLYGGREGTISGVSAVGGPCSILVTIYGGPCDGEARWFRAEELTFVGTGR